MVHRPDPISRRHWLSFTVHATTTIDLDECRPALTHWTECIVSLGILFLHSDIMVFPLFITPFVLRTAEQRQRQGRTLIFTKLCCLFPLYRRTHFLPNPWVFATYTPLSWTKESQRSLEKFLSSIQQFRSFHEMSCNMAICNVWQKALLPVAPLATYFYLLHRFSIAK